ncbi:MAG: hypothetical protein AAF805_12020 [Planctomycetota bacterium]
MADPVAKIPSRRSNPFATCWTSPEAAPYDAVAGVDPEAVVDRLAEAGWRGRIVGPHGAGKTALLRAVAGVIARRGRRPVGWRVGEPAPSPSAGTVLLAEGFERLPPLARATHAVRWRLARVGCVATAHPGCWGAGLPVVARVEPTEQLAGALFERVTDPFDTPVTVGDAIDAFRRRHGDLRAMWFDLYDRHERRTRSGRTAAVAESYAKR